MDEALLYRPLWEVARALERRELSSLELTRAQLARIERVDAELHSYATVIPESALEDARRADAEIARGVHRGALHGVPIAVKDLCATRGVRTAAGMRVLRDRVPDFDAAVVERLREAGAVLLGKLQLTEGAYAYHHPSVSPPLNPWDFSRWVGASSSGSGAATAAGLCFASLGTDTGGSIRFPSACCGVVGLKPTHGRVPLHGVFAMAPSMDHVGPMTRSVRDAALLFDAIAGADARDPFSRRDPVSPTAADLDAGVRGLRIGIDRDYVSDGVDAAVRDAVLGAAELLAGQGAEVVEVRVPSADALPGAWITLCAVEMALVHAPTFPARRAEYGPPLREVLDFAQRLPGLQLQRAIDERRLFCAGLAACFERVDLIACPSIPWTLPGAERGAEDGPDARGTSGLRFTSPFNFSGFPTLSLPAGFSEPGRPLSLQLVARPLDEATLLRAGQAYERETPWHLHHPPV